MRIDRSFYSSHQCNIHLALLTLQTCDPQLTYAVLRAETSTAFHCNFLHRESDHLVQCTQFCNGATHRRADVHVKVAVSEMAEDVGRQSGKRVRTKSSKAAAVSGIAPIGTDIVLYGATSCEFRLRNLLAQKHELIALSFALRNDRVLSHTIAKCLLQ